MSSTITSANPFPLSLSITNASDKECNIPGVSIFDDVIIDFMVNDILTSFSFDITSMISPS